MKQRIYRLLCLMTALFIMSCECPYLLWQCYYPMYVGNVEFKEVRIFSNGKADILLEDIGGSAYYAETFKWRYDGSYLTFTQGNTTYQFQITGFLSPELYLRDSRGKYTWAYRRSEDCIN